MNPITPLSNAVAQSSQVQKTQSADKQRHLRRVQNLAKNTALQGDRLEHQVESADHAHGIQDNRDTFHPQQRRQPRQKPTPKSPLPEDGDEHLDIVA